MIETQKRRIPEEEKAAEQVTENLAREGFGLRGRESWLKQFEC